MRLGCPHQVHPCLQNTRETVSMQGALAKAIGCRLPDAHITAAKSYEGCLRLHKARRKQTEAGPMKHVERAGQLANDLWVREGVDN